MTRESIRQLYEDIRKAADRPSAEWAAAFGFYNQQTHSRLNMSCQPCYNRVREFLKGVVERLDRKQMVLVKLAGRSENFWLTPEILYTNSPKDVYEQMSLLERFMSFADYQKLLDFMRVGHNAGIVLEEENFIAVTCFRITNTLKEDNATRATTSATTGIAGAGEN